MSLELLLQEHVQFFEHRQPGDFTKQLILGWETSFTGRRFMPLSELKKPSSGACAWCNSTAIKGKRKYCNTDCSQSAEVYCYPQSVASKMWRLIKIQNCACGICGVVHEEELLRRINHWTGRYEKMKADYPHSWLNRYEKILLYHLGDNSGDIWQVDHIVPIHKGGNSIGLDNIQVVCRDCHNSKTKVDLGGKRR